MFNDRESDGGLFVSTVVRLQPVHGLADFFTAGAFLPVEALGLIQLVLVEAIDGFAAGEIDGCK